MTEKEAKKIINDGYVKQEYKKSAIHVFCAVVKEARYSHQTMNDTYNAVIMRIISVSKINSDAKGIRPITEEIETIFSYFFNQSEDIPMYIMFWIYECYGYQYAPLGSYTERHNDIYVELQSEYYKKVKREKEYDKWVKQVKRETRRKICQLYKSGQYTAAFALCRKPLDKNLCLDRLEDLSLLLGELFYKEAERLRLADDYDLMALGYLIGLMQGRSENGNGGELTAADERS